MPRRVIVIRTFILVLVALALVLPSYCLTNVIGGAHHFEKDRPYSVMSVAARKLIDQSFSDVDTNKLLDYHLHVVAIGTTCEECYINEEFYSVAHPIKHARFKVYASAAGISDLTQADNLYIERLNNLIDGIENHGRYLTLAFDQAYSREGKPLRELTDFYVSNEYVFEIAKRSKGNTIPAISIHPARKDAIAELEKYAKRGARVVKWLPNAMNIQPADPKYVDFYKAMKKYNMILLSHTGEERAVDAEEYQELGNPLYLRLPLSLGVKVIIAHCASLGKAKDLDAPGEPKVSNFLLFLRLFNDERYKSNLFADISAMTQFNRLGSAPEPEPLAYILSHPEIQKRLVNGSDYPLPAINIVIRTSMLRDLGFLTDEEADAINEIYDFNPLLFDYVLKRTLHHPDNPGWKLAPEIFMERPELKAFVGNP